MKQVLLGVVLVLPGVLVAQRPPFPGIPLTPPPVDHPGLANQPFFQRPKDNAPVPGAVPAVVPVPKPIDPETAGPQRAGKDLAAAVAKVLALPWNSTMAAAMTQSAATGKPILWLQALGQLDGNACSALQSLRGTTLANDLVLEELRDHFVLGRGDLERVPHVGLSNGYEADQTSMGTTNGAGGRNLQIVVLAADGTLVHALPGFWHALDLLPELELARQLHDLYGSAGHTRAQKQTMALTMHRSFVRRLSVATLDRSRWREEDAKAESERAKVGVCDTFVLDGKGQPQRDAAGLVRLKPIVQFVHERLAARLFVKLADFDMEWFVDYGTVLHDDNAAIERGRPFPGAVQNQQRRERERSKAGKKSS